MRQRSSSTVSDSSIPQILHPVLEAALDGLDVELEEELTRYRRQKHRLSRQVGQKQHVQTWQPSKPSIGSAKPSAPLQLPLENLSGSNVASSSAVASADMKTLAAMSRATLNSATLDADAGQSVSRQSTVHQSTGRQTVIGQPTIGQSATSQSTTSQSTIGQPIPRQPAARPPATFQERSQKPRASSPVNASQSVTPDPWLKGDLAIASQPHSQNQTLQNRESQSRDTEVSRSQFDGLDGLDGLDNDASALLAIESGLEGDVWLESRSDHADENPDSYLESTEELLKSIAEETPEVRSEQTSANLLDSLLTPLGIGSMLLLLLSSATLGFVIMHPSSLDFLTAREQATDKSVAEQADGNSNSASSSSQIPDSPNLAAEEFVDLNLNTLSTLPDSPSGRSPAPSVFPSSPSAIAPPSGVSAQGLASQSGARSQGESSESADIAAAPAIPPTVPVEAAPDPYVPPEPVTSEPYYPPADPYVPPAETASPTTETAPADVAAAPTASTANSSAPSGNYYYVVTPYSGDPSLETAREAVPDAYVRNFDDGATVQMGAFSDPTKAEELLQQLQEQGIPAEVYHP